MPNEIAIQKGNGGGGRDMARPIAGDPIRALRDVLRWDPFSEIMPSLRPLRSAVFVPDFEVKETKDGFVFTADLPGIAEKDLQVQLSGNRLSISGQRESEKSEQGDTYYASERSYGSFTRTFTLPEGIDTDKVRAELKNGVLNLTVPKRPEAQPKKISVTSK